LDDDPVTLRDYVDNRFDAQEKAVNAALSAAQQAVNAALAAAQKAVEKAEAATEKRFENSNEWRNTVETLQRTYMPRSECEQRFGTVDEKLNNNAARIAARDEQGKGLHQGWVLLAAIVMMVGTLVAIFYKVT